MALGGLDRMSKDTLLFCTLSWTLGVFGLSKDLG